MDKDTSLAGSLLLAHPSLKDPNFRRAVILLSVHDENGAMGVVLNRPLGRTLGSSSPDFALGPLAQVPLYQGGPVSEERLLLCGWRFHPEGLGFQLLMGLDPDRATQLLGEPGMEIRGFVGYSGWTGQQLEAELEQDTWVTAPISPNLLDLNHDTTLWQALLVAQNPLWALHAAEPEHPERN